MSIMDHVPLSPKLARLLFVSASTYPLGHASDIDVFRTAAQRNRETRICGVILRGEAWFCQVLEGDRTAIDHTWQRICQDTRHAPLGHWWQTDLQQKLFANWHTEHWGVSPQIERIFMEMIRSDRIAIGDKIILVRAFAQVRRSQARLQPSGAEHLADARLDHGQVRKTIDRVQQAMGKVIPEQR